LKLLGSNRIGMANSPLLQRLPLPVPPQLGAGKEMG
jgi:hypothetical protein